jgi:E3 ubiquitin-protein ligase BRE1
MLLESKAENARLVERNREMELEVSLRNTEILSLKDELEAAQSRCDDLLSESNVILKAKASALEELHATKKKYFEVKKSAAKGSESVEEQAGETQFTAKQLSTQLDVYKGRLACPVCNSRDKSCILLRCRHMFCRHCVDTSIKVSELRKDRELLLCKFLSPTLAEISFFYFYFKQNRSRKCPACGIRFDTKDVGDIWL